ncbi:TetR/AcrR family transcriptional regulator [Microbacterium sp.]|uniref:TetR/AcrR family transcriptional regulator n=1 Tax=Microbacterium sp. TaxID=51671 RepID=UPI003C711505
MAKRSEQAARTRQRVLDTARGLFFTRGYAATSLQDIADEMGVVKANVYYYFRTKESIVGELLTERIRELEALLDDVARVDDAQERAERLIVGYIEQVVIAHRSLAPIDFRDPAVTSLPDIAGRLDVLTDRAAAVLFGDRPTPQQSARLALVLDLKPALRELSALSDDDVRAALESLCRTLLAVG